MLAVMAYWAVIRAVPNHDRLAAASVCQAGFETFTPKIRRRVGTRWRTTPRVLERSLGVLTVVKIGADPARCPDAEIAALIERSDADGVFEPSSVVADSPRPQPGAPVAIADGPFRGLNGVYVGMSARERELILLNVLGASRPVEIAARLVVPQ